LRIGASPRIGIQGQPHLFALFADGFFKAAGPVGGQDLVGEIRKLRPRRREIAETEGGREFGPGLVGQLVGQRAGLQCAILKHLTDEVAVVDLIPQAEGAQRHLQQATVGDQLFGRADRADLFAEISLIAAHRGLRRPGRALGRHGALQKRPAGITRQRQGGRKAHARRAAISRSSRGNSARSAFSVW
jgi:hypothetical protein